MKWTRDYKFNIDIDGKLYSFPYHLAFKIYHTLSLIVNLIYKLDTVVHTVLLEENSNMRSFIFRILYTDQSSWDNDAVMTFAALICSENYWQQKGIHYQDTTESTRRWKLWDIYKISM